MKYLMEHEMAFDAAALGFPSIQGCLAVVYQTTTGLYGFHVAGGSADTDWPLNAAVFAQFVGAHGGAGLVGTRLYGASFVGNNQRGYGGGNAKKKWKDELVTFASALAYTGRISGYDLAKSYTGNASAYVEYRATGSKCELHIRQWSNAEHPPRIANPDRLAHRAKTKTYGMAPTLVDLQNTVSGVAAGALTHVHKERLR